MKFTITVDGELKSARAFEAMDKTLRDFTGLWPEIHADFLQAVTDQFETQGVRGAGKWRALSPRYAKWKQSKYPGRPILVLTGKLKKSFSHSGSPDQIKIFEPLSATFGTKVANEDGYMYPGYHQSVTPPEKRRPFIQLTRRDIDRIVSRMYRYTERGAVKAGFNRKYKEGRQWYDPNNPPKPDTSFGRII